MDVRKEIKCCWVMVDCLLGELVQDDGKKVGFAQFEDGGKFVIVLTSPLLPYFCSWLFFFPGTLPLLLVKMNPLSLVARYEREKLDNSWFAGMVVVQAVGWLW